MTNPVGDNQKRREFIRYRDFYLSFLWTLFPTFFFLLGKNFFLFPFKTPNIKFLFPFGNLIHRNTDFFVNILFSIYDFFFKDKRDRGKSSDDRRSLVIKIIRLFIYCIVGVIYSWATIINSNSFLLSLLTNITSFIFSSFLLEIVLKVIDDYGVCNGPNFIYLVELIPITFFNSVTWSFKELIFKWNFSKDNLSNLFGFFFLLAFSFLISLLINFKWESIIENNSFFQRDNKIIEDNKFTFGIRTSFSLFSISEVSSLISLLSVAWYVVSRDGFKTNFLLEIVKNLSIPYHLRGFGTNVNSDRLFESFLAINNRSGWLFINFFHNLKQSLLGSSKFLPALLLVLLVFYSMACLSNYLFRIKPDEISEDLKIKGIYFNQVSIGKNTTRMITTNVIRIFVFWICSVVSLNFLFDLFISNNFANFNRIGIPSFISWFTMISVGNEIFQQIITKYSYLNSFL